MTDTRAIPLRGRLLALCLLTAAVSCSDPIGPRYTDIAFARATWLSESPSDYSFEIASDYSMTPKSDYMRVRVEDGEVAEAIDADGEPVPTFTMTIDTLWQRLLAEQKSGSLHKAEFDARGVPVEVNWGPWELDGGVAHYVRRFRTD